MSDEYVESNVVATHTHDLQPDPEPEEIPTAILEQDEEPAPRDLAWQTAAFGIAIFMVIVLVILLASGGSINLFRIFSPNSNNGGQNVNTSPLKPIVNQSSLNGASGDGRYYGVDGLGTLPDYAARIDGQILPYWVKNGGERIFGKPLSDLLEENGRKFQWFERARLEIWPEHLGDKYEIQPGRIGVEFTKDVTFPVQEFFVNRTGLRYSEVTQHGIRGEFLKFWEANGGIDIFGYPISDELQEVLPEDKAYHTVQYFERARFELHPNDPNQVVKLGLLGSALYKQDSKPDVEPVEPTPVPVTP